MATWSGLLATHRSFETKAEDDFAAMGLTASQAVRLLVHRSDTGGDLS